MDRELAASYHEAGHATAWSLLGWNVVAVSIIRTDGNSGCTYFMPRTRAEAVARKADLADCGAADVYFHRCPLSRLEDRLVAVLAGPLSESRYAGRAVPLSECGPNADLTLVNRFAEIIANRRSRQNRRHPAADRENARRIVISEHIGRAHDLIDQHWETITRVAHLLRRCQCITGDAVNHLTNSTEIGLERVD